MRPNGKTAAALLVVALTSVGCSKNDKAQTKGVIPDAAPLKPVAQSGVPATLEQVDDEEGLAVGTKSTRERAGTGPFDDALNTLMRAGDIEPTSNEVQRLIGRAYHAVGKTDDAIEAYRHAIQLHEKDVWPMNNLGLVVLANDNAGDGEGASAA
jgi:Tfp pilus assembly protein PilF